MILTLEQYRTISGDTESSDATAQRWLNKYTGAIESYCQRMFGLFSGTETHFDIKRNPLILNNDNVAEIVTVIVDGEEGAPSAVHYDLGWLYHNNAWLGKTVVVTYTAGLVAPPVVQEVLLALIAEQGDSVRPVVQETVMGVESVKYGVDGLHPVLGAYASQLDEYRRIRVC